MHGIYYLYIDKSGKMEIEFERPTIMALGGRVMVRMVMRKISILEMNEARMSTAHSRVLMNDKNQHHYDDIIIQFLNYYYHPACGFCAVCARPNDFLFKMLFAEHLLYCLNWLFSLVKIVRSHCAFRNYVFSAMYIWQRTLSQSQSQKSKLFFRRMRSMTSQIGIKMNEIRASPFVCFFFYRLYAID